MITTLPEKNGTGTTLIFCQGEEGLLHNPDCNYKGSDFIIFYLKREIIDKGILVNLMPFGDKATRKVHLFILWQEMIFFKTKPKFSDLNSIFYQ
jgi:hypothetical protein